MTLSVSPLLHQNTSSGYFLHCGFVSHLPQANTGQMDDPKQQWLMVTCNLALIQVGESEYAGIHWKLALVPARDKLNITNMN